MDKKIMAPLDPNEAKALRAGDYVYISGTIYTARDAAHKRMFDAIENALAAGEKVQIAGFGSFETRQRAARTGKNPQTGEAVAIAACKAPAFKAGKALKEAVNK